MPSPSEHLAYRLPLHEYTQLPNAVDLAAGKTGLGCGEARAALRAAGEKVRGLLRLSASPITVTEDGAVSVKGIAGVVAVAPGFELEVVPKFLDPESATWREDFFTIATLSRFGHVLPRDTVESSASAEQSLPALLGRTVVHMYWQNHRRPLRTYERRDEVDFSLLGEVDPADLLLPQPEGFAQRRLALARDNELNSIVAGAVDALMPQVRDPGLQRDLQRTRHALGPQPRLPRPVRRRRLAPRHARWQPLHDLSVQILDGYGGTYEPGALNAPGFVVDTWRAWQDLVSAGLRLGLPGYAVTTQTGFPLGDRDGKTLEVKPDVVAVGPRLLVADAKYIGRDDRTTRLGNTEVYEALAFLRATGAHKIGLFYPGDPTLYPVAGAESTFSVATVGTSEVHAIAIGVQGLSQTDGLLRFSAGVGKALLSI